jgi:hypothetical protein
MGNGGVAPVVLNLTTRLDEWSVSRLCFYEQYPLKRSLVGLHSQSGNLTIYKPLSLFGNHTTIAGSSSLYSRRY